jgi:hypothetical protein
MKMVGHPYFGQWRRLSHPKADLRVVATTPKGLEGGAANPIWPRNGFCHPKGAKLQLFIYLFGLLGWFRPDQDPIQFQRNLRFSNFFKIKLFFYIEMTLKILHIKYMTC